MKAASLNSFSALLPDVITAWAGPAVAGTLAMVGIPVLGPALAVSGICALLACSLKSSRDQKESADADRQALDLLKTYAQSGERDHKALTDQLTELGYEHDVAKGVLDQRLDRLEALVKNPTEPNRAAFVAFVEQNESDFVSLSNFLDANHVEIMKTLKSIATGVDTLVSNQDRSNRPQLRNKTTATATDHNHNRLAGIQYTAQLNDFIGRDAETAQFNAWLDDTTPGLQWAVLLGDGGVGKSRFALEMCLKHQATWHCGDLDPGCMTARDAWKNWQPDQPTLIIIDYVSSAPDRVSRILHTLASRTDPTQPDLAQPVRLLLLERQTTEHWSQTPWGKALTPSDTDATPVTNCYRTPVSPQPVLTPPPSTTLAPSTLTDLSDDALWSLITTTLHQHKPGASPPTAQPPSTACARWTPTPAPSTPSSWASSSSTQPPSKPTTGTSPPSSGTSSNANDKSSGTPPNCPSKTSSNASLPSPASATASPTTPKPINSKTSAPRTSSRAFPPTTRPSVTTTPSSPATVSTTNSTPSCPTSSANASSWTPATPSPRATNPSSSTSPGRSTP